MVRDGRFGPYVTDGTTNASLRRGDNVESITIERAAELLAERRAAGPRPRRARAAKKATKKAAAKKRAPAKKAGQEEGPGQEGGGQQGVARRADATPDGGEA